MIGLLLDLADPAEVFERAEGAGPVNGGAPNRSRGPLLRLNRSRGTLLRCLGGPTTSAGGVSADGGAPELQQGHSAATQRQEGHLAAVRARPEGPTGLAVVVGASGALGGAIAARLVVEGLTVVGVARGATGDGTPGLGGTPSRRHPGPRPRSRHRADREGGGLEWCAADIGSDDAGAAIAAAVGDRPVRMIVQAAGLPAAGPLATIEPDALGRAVALKCGGLLRLVRAVEHNLRPGGRIVALGGHYGIEPAPYACAAGVTNAALANLVRQLATAYGPRGVTAHLVAPGPRTPLGCGRCACRPPRAAACPSTRCWPNAPPSHPSDDW